MAEVVRAKSVAQLWRVSRYDVYNDNFCLRDCFCEIFSPLPVNFCDGLYNLRETVKSCCYTFLKKVFLRLGYQRMQAKKGRRSSSHRMKLSSQPQVAEVNSTAWGSRTFGLFFLIPLVQLWLSRLSVMLEMCGQNLPCINCLRNAHANLVWGFLG